MRYQLSALFYLLFLALVQPANARVDGPGVSGGGDECENRIKAIADDFKSWIRDGGPEGLSLPEGLSTAQYSSAMLAQLQKARVSCVGPGDQGYPVEIQGTPKTCRFDKTPSLSRITCDHAKFRALSEEDQYVLVHHEFAGLAGIEPANGDDSHYEISNQISGYLQETVVKKLSVFPVIDEKALCEKDIEAFVRAKFPYDEEIGERLPIVSVQVDNVMFNDAFGTVEIEAHALFDEYGYSATRIFIESDAVYRNYPDRVSTPLGCENFRVLASFSHPLAE